MYIHAPSLHDRMINNYSVSMETKNPVGSPQVPTDSLTRVGQASGTLNPLSTSKTTGCQACKNRKYVDISNDSSVSFQTPTNIPASASFAKVSSHEQEHVSNEKAKAARDGRRVISQSVQIYFDVCPECGKVYSSGGKTTTITKAEPQRPDFFKEKINEFMLGHFGTRIDTYV
mgnify:CR=1 FL=1|jgi:hypothetical protein